MQDCSPEAFEAQLEKYVAKLSNNGSMQAFMAKLKATPKKSLSSFDLDKAYSKNKGYVKKTRLSQKRRSPL